MLQTAIQRLKIIIKNILNSPNVIKIGSGTRIYRGAVLDTPLGGEIRIGQNCEIHAGSMLLTYGGNISVGDDCSFNPYSIIYGHGGLTIGNGVRIAAQTIIIPANHSFERTDIYIYKQPETRLGIVIEDDVWIGAGAKILDGVKIAKGSVIAAGAVVNITTEPYGVYAGVPAKLIKYRIVNA